MATIINPKVVLNPQPINVDAKIQELQQSFADGIPWLSKAFGRSWKHWRNDPNDAEYARNNNKPYAFPAVYSGGTEYFNCFPNDTLNSYCFFSHRDKAKPVMDLDGGLADYQPAQFNEWEHPVDIIFWFNQKKTHPAVDYPITENLLAEVRKILRMHAFYTVSGVFYDMDNIFDGYTIAHIEEQFVMSPFGGFRIEGKIRFLEQDEFGQC